MRHLLEGLKYGWRSSNSNRSCCESSKLGRQVYSGHSSSGPRSHCVLFCSETAWGPTGLLSAVHLPVLQRHLRRPDPRWPRCWRCLSEAQMCALVMSFPSQVFFPSRLACLSPACLHSFPSRLPLLGLAGALAANKSRILAMEGRTCSGAPVPCSTHAITRT